MQLLNIYRFLVVAIPVADMKIDIEEDHFILILDIDLFERMPHNIKS